MFVEGPGLEVPEKFSIASIGIYGLRNGSKDPEWDDLRI